MSGGLPGCEWCATGNVTCHIMGDLKNNKCCPLYTSDAADDRHCVDLGGRRIIKKKKNNTTKKKKKNTHTHTKHNLTRTTTNYTKITSTTTK